MPTSIGTDADDYLFGDATNDSLSGLGGNDTLAGNDGSDTLDGGLGNDNITDSAGGGTFLGGGGDDYINVVARRTSGPLPLLVLDGGDGADFLKVQASFSDHGFATILAGAGDDDIRSFGNVGSVIDAGAGNDVVWISSQLGEPDTITLGPGADRLRFDVSGVAPTITVTDFQTGAVGDRVDFDPTIHLSNWDGATNPFTTGHFRLVQQGADAILQEDFDGPGPSGAFVDVIRFQNTSANSFVAYNLFGWAPGGSPPAGGVILGTSGFDSLRGTIGADSIAGLGDGDQIWGGVGSDTLDGGDGADELYGESGDDSLIGGEGHDYLAGGEGDDSPSGSDTLSGGVGDDDLNGEDGSDLLNGDDGNDSLIGGGGDDRVFGGTGNDIIQESAGANYLRGDEGDDRINGGRDFDDINGNMGNDTCAGGLGNDWVVGGKDNDVLFGETGDDIVYGNLGDDTCDGGDGADLVRGGQGNDVLTGGAGSDWMSGDRGDDTVSGGGGADIFHTFGEAGIDRVTDFSVSEGDRVQLDPGTQFTVAQVGADTVISMTGGAQMVLVGVQLSSLPNGWIFGA